jgi:predicted nucleotidyltransferase
MTASTDLDKRIVLRLFKDLDADYNPSNISKTLNVTRMGAYKSMKFLEKDQIIEGKTLGKATFYRLRLDDEYTRKNVETLLLEEAKAHGRWKEEFKDIFDHVQIAVLFGSILRDQAKANDIDLLLIYDKKNESYVQKAIDEKNRILTKKIHAIKQTKKDLMQNIQKKDNVVLDAIRTGIVLHGYEDYVGVIKDVTSRK